MGNFDSDAFKQITNAPQKFTAQSADTAPTASAGTPQPQIQKESKLESTPQKDTFVQKNDEPKSKNKVLDYITKYAGIAALAAVPVTAVFTQRANKKTMNQIADVLKKETAASKDAVEEMLKNAAKDSQSAVEQVQKSSKGVWTALAAFAGGAKLMDMVKDDKTPKGDLEDAMHQEIINGAKTRIDNIENTANSARWEAGEARAVNTKGALHSKYLENVDGFLLLKGVDKKAGFDQGKYDKAVETIRQSATGYLHGELQAGKEPLKKGDTVWSITSEFAPIKEGGLGAVPVDVQNNFEKLGIKTPTFIPMYQKNGFSSVEKENGKYTYNYSGTEFELDKVAEFKVHSYKLHDSKDEPVEIFVSNKKRVPQKDGSMKVIDTPPLVFVKNDEYFNGSIYSRTAKAEEPEKFAFFSKAVYEFAKAKEDPHSVKGLNIINKEKYDDIASPDGFLLNDWQAAPMAAMARYKAPMENAYGGLADDAAKKLSDMKIITIGHNAQYQGYTFIDNDYQQKVEVSENILNTLFDNYASDIVKNAATGAPYEDLQNTLIMNRTNGERHVNLLNMGVCLSDYFAPVSKNYAKELVNENAKSGPLQWAIEQRDKSKTLVGIINGNDFKNLDINAKKKFISGINPNNPLDIKTYSQNSSKEDVLAARLNNKIEFYNKYMKPVASHEFRPSRLENVGDTKLPDLTEEEFKDTPIFSYAHRLVGQKGVDIAVDSIKKLYDNWEEDFPNKPKPIFYLGGEDGEGGQNRALIEKLQKELKPEDSNRVVFNHGFNPNPALMSTTDFFLMPSKFEPCGLTQSEAFAFGTPVIATATGGIVDTVKAEGDNQTGILTKDISGQGFYKAMKQGLKTFFDDKPKYEQMVMNSLKEDFSWIQPNKQGPIYEYLDAFNVDKDSLPEKSQIQ
ncbi:MAG: glycogen/starch synthase [Candidatus Gastranaerophilales bacterium]|nr:glycogen/starch synthase [Candidatus Gastranaerophilales bacterium]